MDAVKFLKEYDRMCKSCGFDCTKCGIHNIRNGEGCIETVVEHPEETVAAVKKWSVEHPEKTRQSEFLKMFPKVDMNRGAIGILPCILDKDYGSEKCDETDCFSCRKKYWLAEVE